MIMYRVAAFQSTLLTVGCRLGGASGDDFGEGSAAVDSGSASATPTDGGTDSADADPSAAGSASVETGLDGSDDDAPIFDVGGNVDARGTIDCDCGRVSEFSHLWVANSPESTVSKIDTNTVEEVGRYLTRADAAGSPSRTSVSISGRAVAVANRRGGLIKIFSEQVDCVEKNGQAGLQTSTGADDVLAWGEDECVHWYRDFPGYTVQRPVAWAPGVFDRATCSWSDEAVWTAGCGGGTPGYGGEDTTHVHLIDGETGLDVLTVDVVGYSCQGFGPYGAAVDADGNLWLVQNGGQLARVGRDDLTYEVWDHSAGATPYGLMVDSVGRPWVTSYSLTVGAARFDPVTETWAEALDPILINNGQSGIAQGSDGRVWMGVKGIAGENIGIAGIDPETLAVVDYWPGPASQGKGVSVDGHGFVWQAGGSSARKIDPDDGTAQTYVGLNGAYTYSDMTGFGVANASGCSPPAG